MNYLDNAQTIANDTNINHSARSSLISRNVTIRGHRTSIRLEPEMWDALRDISQREGTTIHNICSLISLRKVDESSLTASIRVFLMLYYRAATTAEGHNRAGHGSFENMKRRARVTEDTLFSDNKTSEMRKTN
jgi:predicted DNA-binding ribbon-helix-helix protein